MFEVEFTSLSAGMASASSSQTPAGSSPHASVASLSMQKAFAISAGVYVNSTSRLIDQIITILFY